MGGGAGKAAHSCHEASSLCARQQIDSWSGQGEGWAPPPPPSVLRGQRDGGGPRSTRWKGAAQALAVSFAPISEGRREPQAGHSSPLIFSFLAIPLCFCLLASLCL